VSTYVSSANLFAGTTYNPYAAPLANLGSPIISQPRPSSSPGLSLGTLGYVLGNSVYNAAASVVAPASRAALSAGISLATSIPSFGQVGTSAADRYITKFGGQSIPAQQQGDLPIRVQQAINQPDRYGVSSHQGQGYIIADPSGAVHFVNDAEVLPTLTLMNRARSEAYEAAGQQSALRFYGNVLTSMSPVHDAARDFGIAGFGYDYFEKNDRFTAQERFEAVLFSAAPGGNAGQARYADDLLDAIRTPTRRVHGNSLEYVGDTHVYVVSGPNGPYKVGESMQGVRIRDQASIRGEAQSRALARQTGQQYQSEIRRTLPDKQSAREYETRFIETFRRLFGDDTLPGNKTNR
jgi:hypothetical protein